MQRSILLINWANGLDCASGGRSTDREEKIIPYVSKGNSDPLQARGAQRVPGGYPFGAGIIFLILAHSAYKMWIIQEPNMLELWNKLYFEEEKKTESIRHV